MATITPSDLTGAAAAPVEALPTPPVAEEPKAETEESRRFSQMARREKMLRAKAREVQTREEALKAREAQLNTPPAPDYSWKDRFKEDPMSMMNEAGVSYDDLLAHMANSTPQDQHIKQLTMQLKKLQDNQDQVQKKLEDQTTQSYQSAVNQIRSEVTQLIKTSADDYEAINHAGPSASEAVVKLIEKTYEEDGYIMAIEDAARDVEEYLIEQGMGYAKLKKVQQKLTPTQAAAQAEVRAPQTKGSATTLSHSMTSQSKPLTQKERRERAILAFQGKLST